MLDATLFLLTTASAALVSAGGAPRRIGVGVGAAALAVGAVAHGPVHGALVALFAAAASCSVLVLVLSPRPGLAAPLGAGALALSAVPLTLAVWS